MQNGTLSANVDSETVPLLQAAVNSDPNPDKQNAVVTIADNALVDSSGPEGTASDIDGASSTSDQISIYVVRSGDSLSSIASMFGVTSNTIRWANDIPAGTSIQEGQTLVILPVSGVEHTVKKGETLQSIAKSYKGDVNEIAQFNNIADNSSLAVGDTLIIPDGESTVVSQTPSSSSKKSNTSNSVIGNSSEGGIVTGGSLSEVILDTLSSREEVDTTGYFTWPIKNAIETQGLHGHNAVDLAAAYGSPILAAASGKVIVSRNSGWNGGYGSYIVISHSNGTQTLYAHLSKNYASVGQEVTQGQKIGAEGETGLATGPHLHFEVRGGNNPFI